MTWCRWLGALALSGWALAAAQAQQRVEVPSLQLQAGAPVPLAGYWFAVDGPGRRPAVVLLHGCGGPHGRDGELSERLADYAAWMRVQGWHALVIDSLGPRGERETCTQPAGSAAVNQGNRRRDALGALQWLAARPEVDAERLALVGWSNGGSTVLAATSATVREVMQAPVKPRAAVAFYPGCKFELGRGYRPLVPLLLLLGEKDDWTGAQPCMDLARRAGAKVQVEVYAGAYHGFDSEAKLRLRRDVPNGVSPGQGVHVGGDPIARVASRERLLAFLREQLQ
jgi:dienelactone hydrolase